MSLIILLFSIGILLLAAEVMVPGGILGSAGGLLLFAACILAFINLGNSAGLIAVAVTILATILVLYIQLKLVPQTRFGKKFFLARQITGVATAIGDQARDLIGKSAEAVTVLSPSGYVSIEGKRYEAFSESGQVASGTTLEVVGANHFQIIVRTKS
ncbi:MAG: serine protease [Armatimonadetes bacterium]|nr:serine protease [Akkermansiaceae bacterium]